MTEKGGSATHAHDYPALAKLSKAQKLTPHDTPMNVSAICESKLKPNKERGWNSYGEEAWDDFYDMLSKTRDGKNKSTARLERERKYKYAALCKLAVGFEPPKMPAAPPAAPVPEPELDVVAQTQQKQLQEAKDWKTSWGMLPPWQQGQAQPYPQGTHIVQRPGGFAGAYDYVPHAKLTGGMRKHVISPDAWSKMEQDRLAKFHGSQLGRRRGMVTQVSDQDYAARRAYYNQLYQQQQAAEQAIMAERERGMAAAKSPQEAEIPWNKAEKAMQELNDPRTGAGGFFQGVAGQIPRYPRDAARHFNLPEPAEVAAGRARERELNAALNEAARDPEKMEENIYRRVGQPPSWVTKALEMEKTNAASDLKTLDWSKAIPQPQGTPEQPALTGNVTAPSDINKPKQPVKPVVKPLGDNLPAPKPLPAPTIPTMPKMAAAPNLLARRKKEEEDRRRVGLLPLMATGVGAGALGTAYGMGSDTQIRDAMENIQELSRVYKDPQQLPADTTMLQFYARKMSPLAALRPWGVEASQLWPRGRQQGWITGARPLAPKSPPVRWEPEIRMMQTKIEDTLKQLGAEGLPSAQKIQLQRQLSDAQTRLRTLQSHTRMGSPYNPFQLAAKALGEEHDVTKFLRGGVGQPGAHIDTPAKLRGAQAHYEAFAKGPIPGYAHMLEGYEGHRPVKDPTLVKDRPSTHGAYFGPKFDKFVADKTNAMGGLILPDEFNLEFMGQDKQTQLLRDWIASLTPAEQIELRKLETDQMRSLGHENYRPIIEAVSKVRDKLKDIGFTAGGAGLGGLAGHSLYRALTPDDEERWLGATLSSGAGLGLGGLTGYLAGTPHGRELVQNLVSKLTKRSEHVPATKEAAWLEKMGLNPFKSPEGEEEDEEKEQERRRRRRLAQGAGLAGAGAAASLPLAALAQDYYGQYPRLQEIIKTAPLLTESMIQPGDVAGVIPDPMPAIRPNTGGAWTTGTGMFHGMMFGPKHYTPYNPADPAWEMEAGINTEGLPVAEGGDVRGPGFHSWLMGQPIQSAFRPEPDPNDPAGEMRAGEDWRLAARPMASIQGGRAPTTMDRIISVAERFARSEKEPKTWDTLKKLWKDRTAVERAFAEYMTKRRGAETASASQRYRVGGSRPMVVSRSPHVTRLLQDPETKPQVERFLQQMFQDVNTRPYSRAKAIGAAARRVLLPRIGASKHEPKTFPKVEGKTVLPDYCKPLPGGGDTCTEPAARVLSQLGQHLGVSPERTMPADLALHPEMEPVGIHLPGKHTRKSVLESVRGSMKARIAVGLLAAGALGLGGYGAGRLLHKAFRKKPKDKDKDKER
jgi:hypothetical protein